MKYRPLTAPERRGILTRVAASLEALGIPEAPELRTQGGLGYPITRETTHRSILESYRRIMGRDPIAYHAAPPNLLVLENLT